MNNAELKNLVPKQARKHSMYGPPTEEDRKKMKQLWANGLSLSSIARELNIGWQRVRKALITEGIWENDTSKKANALYRSGASVSEIARKLNLSKPVVHSYLPYRPGKEYTVPFNQLSETFDKFIDQMRLEEKAESTIASYKVSYSRYAKKFDYINKTAMLEFKSWLKANYAPETANRACSDMNVFCRYMGFPEWCVRVDRIKKISSVENVISLEQYNRLLRGLQADGKTKWYYLVLWMGHTGVRPGDILILTKSCLNTGYQDVTSKGRPRRIYIPKPIIESSREYFNTVDNNLLFPNCRGEKMSEQGLNEQLRRYCLKYGIPKEVARPYSFRHFFAKQFLAHSGDLALLADLMGHWDINTTRIYLRKTLSEQLDTLDQAAERW